MTKRFLGILVLGLTITLVNINSSYAFDKSKAKSWDVWASNYTAWSSGDRKIDHNGFRWPIYTVCGKFSLQNTIERALNKCGGPYVCVIQAISWRSKKSCMFGKVHREFLNWDTEVNKLLAKQKEKPEKTVSSTTSSQSSSSSSSSTDDKIAQAKQICKDLGFKTNTEKFADCSLKMLSMQFEVQNRQALSSGGSQQRIVVNQGYSVGDAMIALSGIISDANRSNYSSGTNCRIFQKHWGADMVCR